MADTTLFDVGGVEPDPDEPGSDSEQSDGYKMRVPCPACRCTYGTIRPKNGQDCVYCLRCDRHCYNAPRAETGKPQRSVSTRPGNGIKPSQRIRIFERDNHICLSCYHPERPLHIGHIISVKDGLSIGMPMEDINDDLNLMTQCEECNLGQGDRTMDPRISMRIWRQQRILKAKRDRRPE